MESYQGITIPTWFIPGDSNLDNVVKFMSARFHYSKLSIFPFPFSILWNRVTKYSSYSKGRKLSPTRLLEEVISTYYLEFLKDGVPFLPIYQSFVFIRIEL